MLFEIIAVIVLNLLYAGGSFVAYIYKGYCKHTIEYLKDVSNITSLSYGVIRTETVEDMHLQEAANASRTFAVAFICNILVLLITHLSYLSGTPLNTITILSAQVINIFGIYHLITVNQTFRLLAERVILLHITILHSYRNEELFGVKDVDTHTRLGNIIEKYRAWLGGPEVLEEEVEVFHGEDR